MADPTPTSEWFVVINVDGIPHYDTGALHWHQAPSWSHDQGKAYIWTDYQSAFERAGEVRGQVVHAGTSGSNPREGES